MVRAYKYEVGAVNIRISEKSERNYSDLIQTIALLRKGIKVLGNTFLAISTFDETTGVGVFSKYTSIDINGEWFDEETFNTASDESVAKISIPENVKPNLSQFYFKLDEGTHTISFETYAQGKTLSPKAVEIYFQGILKSEKVASVFGRVEVDLVQSFGNVKRILKLPDLKELTFVIRRPNPDGMPDNLAEIIERRLNETNSETYVEQYVADRNDSLIPTDRLEALALVAAENGELKAKSIVNGVKVPHATKETPLKISDKISKEVSERGAFLQLSSEVVAEVRDNRDKVKQLGDDE